MRKQKFNKKPRVENLHNINSDIRAYEVRLIGENVENSGDVVSKSLALQKSKDLDLDLVEINSKSNPPICKIVEYKKFLYEEKKQKKEQAKKQKQSNKELKEMQFTPNIGDADISVKKKKIEEFITKGHKVKMTMKFKGREIQNNKDKGELILLNIASEMEEICKVESLPKLNGLRMIMTISQKK